MEAPDFWNDPVVSQEKMKELKSLKDDVQTYATLSGQYDDIETMIEMGYEEEDPELIPEIAEMMDEFVSTYENIRMKTLLSGEYDRNMINVDTKIRGAIRSGNSSSEWMAEMTRFVPVSFSLCKKRYIATIPRPPSGNRKISQVFCVRKTVTNDNAK